MSYQTDWIIIEVDDDRYRIAVQPSNSTRSQGKVKVEKFIGDKAKNWGWGKVGWNGVLNLFDKLPDKWDVLENA